MDTTEEPVTMAVEEPLAKAEVFAKDEDTISPEGKNRIQL